MKGPRILKISLGEVGVGYLTHYPDGRNFFVFDEDYVALGDARPVLSLSFTRPGDEASNLERLGRQHSRGIRLPEYFSNLLPEGALREYLIKKLKIAATDEFVLLTALGRDLPGAVVAVPSDHAPAVRPQKTTSSDEEFEGTAGLFSLGGAQLKFSMIERGGRFRLSTEDGDWIVKPPHPIHAEVPANEFSMMTLAREVGVEIPDIRLVDLAALDTEGLDGLAFPKEAKAYAIKRYDRAGSHRVHAEDFAQVFSVYAEREYEATNYDTIARTIFNVFPDRHPAVEEFFRRLVVNVLIGNGDAHLKNWSVLYPDGRTPRLSPAYDLLSTVAYVSGDKLALNLGGEKRFEALAEAHFARLAVRAGIEEKFALGIVRETVDRARESWPGRIKELPLSGEMRTKLKSHWATLSADFRI